MSKLLDRAVDAVRALPLDEQDDIARAMLALAGSSDEPEMIDPNHLAAVLEGLSQFQRGESATAEQVEVVFRRFDR